jgi:hypothetical protein
MKEVQMMLKEEHCQKSGFSLLLRFIKGDSGFLLSSFLRFNLNKKDDKKCWRKND